VTIIRWFSTDYVGLVLFSLNSAGVSPKPIAGDGDACSFH